MILLFAIILLCEQAKGQEAASNWIKVDPTSQRFVDDVGRERLFHGVNAVYKIFPWLPSNGAFNATSSLGPQDADLLASWGFNVVRLGVMWPGVQPTDSASFNYTYLSAARSIVDLLASRGIYTIVDFHQDIFSRKFCGEGVPDWAVEPDPTLPGFAKPTAPVWPVNETTGYPSLSDCLSHVFGIYYPSYQVSAAFQRLYENTNNLQDQLAVYWQQVAKTFLDAPSVLGFELINEPWAGDIYAKPELIIPGYCDKHYLSPMYQNLNKAIRQYDDTHIIFFEDALVDLAYRTGFTPELTPGGAGYQDRQALSYHIYCGPSNAEGDPRNIYECDLEDDYFYTEAMADVRQVGAGSMMTEFGAVTNASTGVEELAWLTSLADKYVQSWAYWQYKSYFDITTQNSGPGESLFGEGGALEYNKVKTLARSYAQAVAGTIVSQHFDPRTSRFDLNYTMDTSITAPTTLFLNIPMYYPKGISFSATTIPNTYSVQLVPSSSSSSSYYTVQLSPTPPPSTQISISLHVNKRL